MREVGGDARIVPAGELTIDGHKVICGKRPTVMDNNLDDYGASYQGFFIPNPKHLATIKSTAVKLWIHALSAAISYEVPTKRRPIASRFNGDGDRGWLTFEGLVDVCKFMAPAKGDNMHFTGTQRCDAMKACYDNRSIR